MRKFLFYSNKTNSEAVGINLTTFVHKRIKK
jgi:hypothetical protein